MSKNKPNFIKRAWMKWGEMFVSRTFLPYTLYFFIKNLYYYLIQRNKIKKALLGSQELVDSLDENGFYFHEVNMLFFKFRTYALDSIQLLSEHVQPTENLHEDFLKRLIVTNIKDLLNSAMGKVLGENTSLNIVQPQEKVLLIRLAPSWMRSVWVSLIDITICLVFSIISLILCYYFLF